MKIINAQQVEKTLSFEQLIPLLKQTFKEQFTMPQRQVLRLDEDNSQDKSAFALLPSWNNEVIGNKMFTYFPNNKTEQGLASLYSKIMLFDRKTGEPLALVDGTSITYWRTAAVSALASQLLSRENSQQLVLFGTGNLAPYLLHAHLTVRALTTITLCGRNTTKVAMLIKEFSAQYPNVSFNISKNLPQEIADADIIVCATAAKTPLFNGEWLSAGTHIDCLGNHNIDARECDTKTILKASVYVDSMANNLAEAGEILLPIAEEVFNANDIIGELTDLCKSIPPVRQSEQEITLFKSVGTAISDLVTANFVQKQTNTINQYKTEKDLNAHHIKVLNNK
jgi:1-pyrroline-2-carboxylate reductase [NAD(P)H]